MKIRWTRNSIRLRITPLEWEQVQGGGEATERLQIAPSAAWSVTLAPSDATRLDARPDGVRLTLSSTDLERMAAPDVEGVSFESGGEPRIRCAIEKDFECAHPRAAGAEETSDVFAPTPEFQRRKRS